MAAYIQIEGIFPPAAGWRKPGKNSGWPCPPPIHPPPAKQTAPYMSTTFTTGVRQALISLSDKTDLPHLGNGLQSLGFSIISTGGTASSLEATGVDVTKVEQITHFPEMLDGRVKTLHPSIHGGILARRDQEHHLKALDEHGIGTFDVVVVNLYPFYDKVTSGAISSEDGIENIDIGGPTLIRVAAKICHLKYIFSKAYAALQTIFTQR